MDLRRLAWTLPLFFGACDFIPLPPGGSEGESSIGDTSISDGSAGDGSAGEPERTESALCHDACVNEGDCWLPPGATPDLDQCISDCIENLHAFDGDAECEVAMFDYTTCMADAPTCDAACLEITGEAVFQCERGHGSFCSSSTNAQSGPECSFEKSCSSGDGETGHALTCIGDLCTCFEDGVEVGGCTFDACAQPSPDPTGDFWSAEEVACCGWIEQA